MVTLQAMGKGRHLISLLLLALLMVAKASSMHVFSHGDTETATIENCSWCHLAIVGQQAEFVTPEAINYPQPEAKLVPAVTITELQVLAVSTPFPPIQFSRPPPAAC